MKGPKSVSLKNNLPIYYQNFLSGDTAQVASIWNKLNSSGNWLNRKYAENAVVQINHIDERRIKFYLYEKNQLMDSLTLKGKIYKDYFSVKRKVRVIGIPLIYYWYYESKLLIGFSADEKLLVKSSLSRFGMIFIISGGNTEIFCTKYDKK